MGFLEKMGLVEAIPDENEAFAEESTPEYSATEVVEVSCDNVSTENLIADVYAQNNLHDMSESIFKVEEVMNTLPNEMVTETKRSTVLTILNSFGLTATEATEDGERRVAVLNGVRDVMNANASELTSEKSAAIEEHKKAIAELEKEISDLNSEAKHANEAISAEIDRVSKLINFVGGTR